MAETPMSFEYPFIPDYKFRDGFGTQAVDWEERINYDRMRKYRLGRVKEQLKAYNIGAILSINEWNTRYITSTWTPHWTTPSSGLRYCLMCATAKAPTLYEQGEIGFHARQMAPWLDKVKVAITGAGWSSLVMGPEAHIAQRNKLVKQIVDDLKANGVAKEILALDVWDPGLVEGFQKAGIKVSPLGMELMLMARKNKNQDEVECLKIASAIGDTQFMAVKEMLKPGVRENEIVGMCHKVAYDKGAYVYSGIFCTSGVFSWPNSRDLSDRMIRPGDIVFVDVYNTSYNGYKICYYRTFCCGKAPQKAKDDYKRAVEWLYNSINIIKPGVTTAEVAEKWPASKDVWKPILVKYEDQTAGSNWAHGIGLSLYEFPLIWREVSFKYPQVIEEGMTFAIETQHGSVGEYGGVRMEEMIHVTKTGVEVMSKWPVWEITEVPF